MRHHTVTSQESGMRLDQYFASVKPDFTRAFIQKMIKDGCVFVNSKKIAKTAHKLREGDELVLVVPSIKEIGINAEDIPLEIVYEDSDLAVVNKPAGMAVHPTDHGAHVSGTLVNALMHHCRDLSGIGGEKRPGIVHRLDKDTSGIIITAKSDKAHQYVAKQIEARTVTKKYLTLLKGHLSPEEGSVEAPLLKAYHGSRNKGGGADMKVAQHKDAKYALTHYKVLEHIGGKADAEGAGEGYSLVEVRIVTGRTHQIRVHFAAIGHPVCGDDMYGDKKLNAELRESVGLRRQFLHAAELTFKIPKNDEEVTLKAPLAKDLEEALKKLR